MKSLACKELGDMGGCEFVATGETNEDVKKAVFDHAAESHKEILENMTEEQKQEMMNKMDMLLNNQ